MSRRPALRIDLLMEDHRRVEGRLHTSVNEGVTAAAVAGRGILSTGLWGCRTELKNGSLIQILKDWHMGTSDLHAVFPAGRAAKPSARQFIDFLLSQWADTWMCHDRSRKIGQSNDTTTSCPVLAASWMNERTISNSARSM
jgi:DNA-binding transcriptional LysR family regulator